MSDQFIGGLSIKEERKEGKMKKKIASVGIIISHGF